MQFQADVTGGAVDGDEQVELVFTQVDLGGVDMKETWFVGLESLSGGLFLPRQQVGKAGVGFGITNYH